MLNSPKKAPRATQPVEQVPAPVQLVAVRNTLRIVISVCETAGFIVASALALMNNGADFRHAIVAALLAFVAHGVNHNAGGSPV